MSRFEYHEPAPYDRADAVRALHATEPATVCAALVGIAFHEPDWRWVQGECVRLATHPDVGVRSVVASCFGHLARIHGTIDLPVVDPVLAELARDPEVAGRVSDARDDFAMFLKGAPDRSRTR